LRAEERQRAQALLRLLPALDVDIPETLKAAVGQTQLGGMALAARHWEIDCRSLCRGYLWSWLENAVMAGVKLVPLGQTDGQRLLMVLSDQLPTLLDDALHLDDRAIGSSTPAMAIASSLHETQYSRLFRS
ncbi:MAG: urease accessory protein UreF, partial [Oceanospirillales bacterium]|nr:urease accessory protein UreF [Oceanospirillales bacterium]